MDINVEKIRESIDFTLLSPQASSKDFEDFYLKTLKYGFKRVFVPPFRVKEAVSFLKSVVVGTVSGFPHGNETISSKVYSAEKSIENGALEIDFVMNIGKAIDEDFAYLEEEFKAMASLKSGITDDRFNIKVILETCFLNKEIIETTVRLAADTGLDFVKTSTGYGPKGASIEDIKLMKEAAQGRVRLKASGGIRTLEQVIGFLKAGAERIGTSAGDQILLEAAAILPD